MNNSIIFSRRAVESDRKVDFRPDNEAGSPSEQARRLASYLAPDVPHDFPDKDIDDCPDAIAALREYQYRKIHTNTSHYEFLEIDESDPQHIDWQIRVHEIESANFQASRKR